MVIETSCDAYSPTQGMREVRVIDGAAHHIHCRDSRRCGCGHPTTGDRCSCWNREYYTLEQRGVTTTPTLIHAVESCDTRGAMRDKGAGTVVMTFKLS